MRISSIRGWYRVLAVSCLAVAIVCVTISATSARAPRPVSWASGDDSTNASVSRAAFDSSFLRASSAYTDYLPLIRR